MHNRTIQSGFSLVELVIVLIVLGIVSVTVAPRFFGTTGFAEFAAQQQLLSALRVLQTKSMYDSSGGYCYRMVFDSAGQEIGPTVARYETSTAAASCATAIATNPPQSLSLDDADLSSVNVSFSTSDNGSAFSYIQFDSLGRPSTSAGTCALRCEITISGEQTTQLCIGVQGYVYEC
ncbi:MAG: type II secretion system protein [Pseudomonadota bacterium]